MTGVKVCGITSTEDAWAAVASGANALGFVFAPSPRQVNETLVSEIRKVIPGRVCVVGVFATEPVARMLEVQQRYGLDYLQVHGPITEQHRQAFRECLIPAITVRDGNPVEEIRGSRCSTVLLDAYHADRHTANTAPFDWTVVRTIDSTIDVILAGGLNSDNVTDALETARPMAVDVSSGVELSPGKKDHQKLRAFIQRVHAWDSQTHEATSVSSVGGLFLRR